MAFLSCTSDFSPLFRLLADYETHHSRPAPTRSSACKSTSTSGSTSTSTPSRCPPTPTHRTVFLPAFDVRELPDAYYLDGELPGVDQSNIDIEFTDPQTLVVKGRTERNYTSSTIQSASPQPTVEDDEDDEGNMSDARSTASSSASSTRSTSAVIVEKPSPSGPAQTTQSSTPSSPKEHYWIAERSIGEFQRTFSFPVRVEQDNVRAALKNGILSIIVPKEAAPKAKKIRIY
ncbi:30 kDa heat shock protein [Penicillium daleae]|uniref:30 kDa heat shock protein n=1 Tax=Penicillium daleae TaxID=63821 RepID=A0AAD6G085_9EURO|nr:30 kDa heat shock protein [Penicillium daleae]KAJ5443877.1 30 kDa heat shock protein [Penicillium daleae]